MTMLEENCNSVTDDVSTEQYETFTESDSESIIELDLSPPRDNLTEMARYRWKVLKEIIRSDDNASRVSTSEKKMPKNTLKKLQREKAAQLKAIRLEWDKKLKAAARRLENAHLQVEKSHVNYQENHVLLQKRMIELKQKAAVISHTKEDSQKIPDRTNSSQRQRELAEGNLKIRKIHAEFDRLKVRQKMLTKMSRQRESMMSPGTPNGPVKASRSSSTFGSDSEHTLENSNGVNKVMSSHAMNAPQYNSIRQSKRTSLFNMELEPTLENETDTFPPLSPQLSMASQHPSIRPGRRTSIFMAGFEPQSHIGTTSQHNSTKTSRTNSIFGSELEFTLQNNNGKIISVPSQALNSSSPVPPSATKRVNTGQDAVVASEALLARFRSLGLASEAELLNTAEAERENAENRLKEELQRAKENARAQMELVRRKEREFIKLQKMRVKFRQLIHLERQRIIQEALREKRREEALKRRAINLKMKEEFKKLQHEARISSFYRTSYFEPRRKVRPHPLL